MSINKYLITEEEKVYLVKAQSSYEAVLKVLHYNGDDYSVINKISGSLELAEFIEVVNHYTNGYSILSVSQVEMLDLYGKGGCSLIKIDG